MGREQRIVRILKCLRCSKEFPSKPKRDKAKNYITDDYCLQCRLLIKRTPKVLIRSLNALNLQSDVEILRRIELSNPVLIKRLREPKRKV